jgi:hypothetical protein
MTDTKYLKEIVRLLISIDAIGLAFAKHYGVKVPKPRKDKPFNWKKFNENFDPAEFVQAVGNKHVAPPLKQGVECK